MPVVNGVWVQPAPTLIQGLPVFEPPVCSDTGMPVTPRQAVLEANYGEYVQRAADGIHSLKYDLSPSWINTRWADAKYILEFFRERGRWKPFWWTAPEEPRRLYVVDAWPYKWKSGRVCDIGPCTFVETSLP